MYIFCLHPENCSVFFLHSGIFPSLPTNLSSAVLNVSVRYAPSLASSRVLHVVRSRRTVRRFISTWEETPETSGRYVIRRNVHNSIAVVKKHSGFRTHLTER